MRKHTVSGLAVFLSLLFVAAACSKDEPGIYAGVDKRDEKHSTTLSYKFTELTFGGAIKCTTEERTFDSEQALCEGLTQQEENNYCALEEREKMYNDKGCPGEFEET